MKEKEEHEDTCDSKSLRLTTVLLFVLLVNVIAHFDNSCSLGFVLW